MEPHGRDGPQEEFMEDLIRGETDRIDITKVFLMESGEGDESLGRRDRTDEEEVERGLYPSDDGEDGSGDDDGEADSSGHEEADGDGEVEVRCIYMYIN